MWPHTFESTMCETVNSAREWTRSGVQPGSSAAPAADTKPATSAINMT